MIKTLRQVEDEHIAAVVNHFSGSRIRAADALKISIRTLRLRLHEIRINRPDLFVCKYIEAQYKHRKIDLDNYYSACMKSRFNRVLLARHLMVTNVKASQIMRMLKIKGYAFPDVKGIPIADRRKVISDFIDRINVASVTQGEKRIY